MKGSSPVERRSEKGRTPGRSEAPPSQPAGPAARARAALGAFPWGRLLLAAIPVGLGAHYLADVAPGLVPVPPEVKVPFPGLVESLGGPCAWCGENPAWVWGAGGTLLAAGALLRSRASRYYAAVAIAAAVALAFAWYSISAPIDRLLRSVEAQIPQDDRVPPPAAAADRDR